MSKPRVTILYCRQCNWLLRAAWMAQELLSTFAEELGEVALVPGTGGVFEIACDGTVLWERKRDVASGWVRRHARSFVGVGVGIRTSALRSLGR
mgnify:CR=1 FL=1